MSLKALMEVDRVYLKT